MVEEKRPENVKRFEKLAGALNIYLNKSKFREGSEFIFTGHYISLKEKLIRVRPEKCKDIEESVALVMRSMMVSVDKLERLLGLLEFAAGVSHNGRVNIFYGQEVVWIKNVKISNRQLRTNLPFI